jgi:hypothetical protein
MIEKEMFIKNGKVISADDVYLDPRDATIEAQAAEIEHLKDVYSSATECFLEAQEEIERLRKALERIASGRYSGVMLTSFPPKDAAVEAARAALGDME